MGAVADAPLVFDHSHRPPSELLAVLAISPTLPNMQGLTPPPLLVIDGLHLQPGLDTQDQALLADARSSSTACTCSPASTRRTRRCSPMPARSLE